MMKKTLFFSLLALAILTVDLVLAVDKVDINIASLQQLDTLTGIGPVYAQRIIDGRPYSSIDDLNRVKGIGPATLQKIKDQGLACLNCSNNQITETAEDGLPSAPVIYPAGIYINEILPNPEGADETEEWIELYNSGTLDVDLTSWQIQDTVGTTTTFTIPKDTKILANGFLVFKRPQTNIMLNNDEDGLNLLTPDKKIVSSVKFSKAPLGQSYNKTSGAPSGSWIWRVTLTPGSANVVNTTVKTLPASATPKALQAGLSKTKNSVTNDGVELGLASLTQNPNSNQDNKITNPWFLFFTVLATTIILATLVLLIKLNLFKNHVRT